MTISVRISQRKESSSKIQTRLFIFFNPSFGSVYCIGMCRKGTMNSPNRGKRAAQTKQYQEHNHASIFVSTTLTLQ
jgi:hypothetical protein